MKNLFKIITIALILFLAGCKKEKDGGQWNIKIEDGADIYNYSGLTYNPLTSDGTTASFSSFAGLGSSGSTNFYNTQSHFLVKLGNITSIGFDIVFSTADSAITAALKTSNSNTIRFNAFKQVVKTGVYSFNNAKINPFIIYVDKNGMTWSTDFSKTNSLEIISVSPNTQDNTANALITQINFDIALKDINNTLTKRIKGSTFNFFNLD